MIFAIGIYNSADCEYDGGNCNEYKPITIEFPNCSFENVDQISKLRNGKCDVLYTPECGFDAGDCFGKCLYQ